jgi:hypothetical protein
MIIIPKTLLPLAAARRSSMELFVANTATLGYSASVGKGCVSTSLGSQVGLLQSDSGLQKPAHRSDSNYKLFALLSMRYALDEGTQRKLANAMQPQFRSGNGVSRLAGAHWGNLRLISSSNHLKCMIVFFSFVHLPSEMNDNNTDPVIILR